MTILTTLSLWTSMVCVLPHAQAVIWSISKLNDQPIEHQEAN